MGLPSPFPQPYTGKGPTKKCTWCNGSGCHMASWVNGARWDWIGCNHCNWTGKQPLDAPDAPPGEYEVE